MIKLVLVVTRKPGMTHEEYIEYVKHVHGYQITCANPLGISKYLQNYVFDGAYGTIGNSRDSITELYFEDKESMDKTFSDPYVHNVVGPDGANFNGETVPFLVTEKEIEVVKPSAGGIKVFYFIKKNDSLSSDRFHQLWFESHHEVVKNSETVKNQLGGFIHNIQISQMDASSFGPKDPAKESAKETVTYDGIATMWFESTTAFRAYQSELAAIAQKKDNFIDQSKTFFLYTDSLTIYEKGNL